MHGSAPPTPTPISISTTTRSILTSSTSTRTRTSATWCGFSMPSRCSTSCAARASSACKPLRFGASARKTARCGTSGTSPAIPQSLQALGTVQPGHDVDTEGDGDILRVTGLPQPGKRTVEVDTDEPDPRKKLIVDEHMDVYPRTYTVEQYGYHPNEVALSFDDGPDPKWTPKILDILKQKHVKGTFMLIGAEAAEQHRPHAAHRARRQRDRQPHLDASRHQRNLARASSISRSISPSASSKASWACSRSTSARPTISTRSPTPTTRPRPSWRIQQDGLTIIGSKIDTDDWNEHPRKIAAGDHRVGASPSLQTMKTKPQFRGSIILHARRRRRPLRHRGRARPCSSTPCAPTATPSFPSPRSWARPPPQVMPPLTFWQRVRTIPDSIAFSALDIIGNFIVMVFFVGDVLMSARLIIVGLFAVIDRLQQAAPPGLARLQPARRRSHPRLQRGDGHRPHHPLRAQLRLQEPPRHRHRRRLAWTAPPKWPPPPTPRRSPPAACRSSPSATKARPPRSTTRSIA